MDLMDDLATLADELDRARAEEKEVRARLKTAVLAHIAAGVPVSHVIAESRLARQTVYDWMKENR